MNNGPAFPTPYHPLDGRNHINSAGMSLRQYYVGQVVTAMEPPKALVGDSERAREFASWARRAVEMADALIAAESRE